MPEVINVKDLTPGTPGVMYCGRAWAGWPASVLANPFKISPHLTRDEAIAAYRRHLRVLLKSPHPAGVAARAALDAITQDTKLGCWCWPQACHCDVILELWLERHDIYHLP